MPEFCFLCLTSIPSNTFSNGFRTSYARTMQNHPHIPSCFFFATDALQAFRPNEDVDISGDGNYHVAWIREGEFLRYTVNVVKAGE